MANNIILPESLLYTRALAAMKLTSANRSMEISSLEGRNGEQALESLNDVAVKISGFHAEGSGKEVMMTNPDADWAEYDESGEVETQSSSDIWVSKGGKTQRNRPGAHASAAKGDVRSFNVPNGFTAGGKNGRIGKGEPPSKSDRCVR